MKKKTLIIPGIIILFFAVGIFWTVHALDQTPKSEPLKNLTQKSVQQLSEQTKSTLQSLANSGGDTASQKQLTALISSTKQYKLTSDANSTYVKNLTACLETLQQYKSGKADKKALGHVYPTFVTSENKLSDITKTTQYQWFYAAAANYEQGLKQKGVITLTMVGDNSFGTYPETPEHLKFDNVFKKNNGTNTYVYQNCLPWFKSDDYTVINAESAFTNATKAEVKMWRIKSNPAHVAFLPASGVDAANLANNHTMDYFQVGYDDTLKAFKDNDIPVFNKNMPLITKIGGIETILLGYDCRSSQQSASYLAKIEADVKKYKKSNNLVIVNMHWGVEYHETPVDYQTQYGHAIIDAGADIIMGSHPHRLESVEKYNGKYIVYSMGDFAFGADPTLLSRMTSMFRLRFTEDNGKVVLKNMSIVPTYENSDGSLNENNYQPLPVFGDDAKKIVNELIRISKPIQGGVTEYDYFDPFI
ncbi:CapA family protein [Listeria newyorkensis]|uniref:CapA family protein n=1 Tax=Listeria newyorkensis TaxID=1497681 RepID=A0A841YW33_9LIST|nr:CapA family protein [Listeria newyorkensis]MBC1457309.1 CapA family protein [Listeria newyorkensis]